MKELPLVVDDAASGLQAVPVKDAQAVQLLAELVAKTHDDGEAVELLRQLVIAATTEREDAVSRVEGDVRVHGPVTLDDATLEQLALLVGQLGGGQGSTVTFDQGALDELKAAVKPVRVTGGSQTRRVQLLGKTGGRIDPATTDLQTTANTKLDTANARLDLLATQATLADILTELTRTNNIVHSSASTGTGFTTIAEVTPASDVTVTGYSADVTSLTDIRYGVRLATGADGSETVLDFAQITSGQNSWVPITVDIAANTRIVVQVDESEVGTVACEATIAYR